MFLVWILVGTAIAGLVVLFGRARRRRLALVLGLAVAGSLLSFPTMSAADPEGSAAPVTPAEAMAQARKSGKQVEVTSLASPTTRVMADPTTGGFAVDVTAQVSRVQTSTGSWRDASSKLIAAGDGSWRTEATPVGIRVGGSGGRLFEFSSQGGSLGLSWPEALPSPVIDASTATYPNVLPGVDLVVRAQISGVGTYLVVKDATAAANPALDKIAFEMKSSGVKPTQKDNGLAFSGISGTAKFAIAEPFMWDSRCKQGIQQAVDATSAAQEAKGAPMTMIVTDATVEVIPDMSILRSPDTTFPVVIDPYVHDDPTAVVRITEDWTHVNQWDEDAKIGYNGWTSPYYKSRMYYNFTLPSLAVADVASAKFYAKQIHSPQHDCKDTDFGPSVTAAVTTQVKGSSDWGDQPTWRSGSDNDDYAVGHEDYCSASYVQKFDLTGAIKTAWASSTKIGIGMKSSSEGDKNGWRHYKQVEGVSTTNPDGSVTSTWYPRIVIDYQPTPLAPAAIAVSNGKLVGDTWATSNAAPSLSAKLAIPSPFRCDSATPNCLVAEWTLPSGAVVRSPGVSTGITSTLTWPATEPPLSDHSTVQLQVVTKNTVNGKASAPVIVKAMYDEIPSSPVLGPIDTQASYLLNTGIQVDVTSSSPDVTQICWTASPASPNEGCQAVTGGAGAITLTQSARPETEMTYTTFSLVAVDQSGLQSTPKTLKLYFTTAP